MADTRGEFLNAIGDGTWDVVFAAMRTLFLSGNSTHAALLDRVTADPGAFLQKPFTVKTLLAQVRERLART